jgi:two-component system, LytTR family, response regulator
MSDEKIKLKVVIIDDEERSRLILKQLIEEYIKNVKVVAMAADVLEGVKVIQQQNPDVVFLDIEMPGYSGFNLIEYFDENNPSGAPDSGNSSGRSFKIVFTTAYEKYAIKAYKAAAFGYLLKPIDIDELIDIFDKLFLKHKNNPNNQKLNVDTHQKIIFPTQSGLIYLKSDEICYFESSGRYTKIYLTNKENMLTTLSLKDCCDKLADSTFIRVHRSFIINLSFIQNYSRGRDSFVIMDNNARVDVGLSFKEDLNKAISSFLK